MTILDPWLKAAGRTLVASLFIWAGYEKIVAYEASQAYMANGGVPGALLPLVIAAELGGGLALLAGWQTRIVALALAAFTLAAALLYHTDFANHAQVIQFMKNLAIAAFSSSPPRGPAPSRSTTGADARALAKVANPLLWSLYSLHG